MFRQASSRGWYFIELLIVLIIVMILTLGYFGKSLGGVNTYKTSMDKTKSMDCAMSRRAIQADAASWSTLNPNQAPTIEALKNAGYNIPRCRQSGVYSFGPAGEVYCTVHNPAPTPTPTPLAIDFLSSGK